MTATVTQAYRFALDPTPSQVRDLERHAGAARFAYNWALAAVKANLGQRDAERSYGLDGEDLTAVLGWNLPALRRAWNTAKGEAAPWWSECCAPCGASLYSQLSWEELEGMFLGCLAYLDVKTRGDKSMPGKRWPSGGVQGGVP